ncbi:MAG TPA: hypothetical protein PKM38_10440, partial [Syntrophorhabdaceae bacterium]|nr:hypothetical protein [Syntrophorhabdaceae bacterium]
SKYCVKPVRSLPCLSLLFTLLYRGLCKGRPLGPSFLHKVFFHPGNNPHCWRHVLDLFRQFIQEAYNVLIVDFDLNIHLLADS